MKLWCEIRGYRYNPDWWMNTLSMSDQKRGWKRVKDDTTQQSQEFFYIENPQEKEAQANRGPFCGSFF